MSIFFSDQTMASRRLHFFALLLLGISSTTSTASTASTTSTSTTSGTPLQWSVSIHANTECGGQNLTRCAEVFSRALELGATAVRTDVFWQDLEPTADGGIDHDACSFYAAYFALARDMGLEPVVILSGAPSWAKELITTGGGDNDDAFFARVGAFVDVALSEVVAASGASPAVFQLWNELNDPITSGWLTLSGADHACRLLRVMGGKVGAAYPNATRFVNLLVDELPWQRSLDRWLEPDCAGEALPTTTTDAVPRATVAKAAGKMGGKKWQGRQRLRRGVDNGKEMASRSATARAFIDGAALDHYPGTWSTPRNFTDWRSLQTLLQRVTDASHDDNPWLGLAAAVFETGYSSWNGVASSEADQERWVRESLPAMRAVIDEFAKPSSRVDGEGRGAGAGMASGASPTTPFLVNMYQLVDSAERSQESVSVEGHFGFVFDEPSLGPKPAFAALQAEMMADAVYSNRPKSRPPPFNVGNGVVVAGPYEASNKTLSFSGMDSSSPLIDVFFPSLDQEQHEKKEKQTRQGGNADERRGGGAASMATSFPLIVYAHGKTSATPEEHYRDLFRALVSFGFVVVAPRACANGCDDDRASLPRDPPGFAHYYEQQLLAIDWARQQSDDGDESLRGRLNFTGGVAIAGHSMGGQATLFSSSDAAAVTSKDIRVAVMHHAYTHSYPAPGVPFLAFTSALDFLARPRMTRNFYCAAAPNATADTDAASEKDAGGGGGGGYGRGDGDGSMARGLVDKLWADHSEPDVERYNPLLAQFTAAWIKLHLGDGISKEFGLDYDNMIFGNNATASLCAGGDGAMVQCEIHRGDDVDGGRRS